MLNRYVAAAAPQAAPIIHEPTPMSVAVNGTVVGTFAMPAVQLAQDTRAAFAYDILKNDQLVATVYGDTQEQAANRASRWATMLTAADVLTNGEGDI